ncbi:MAG: L-threonylcarbamoyladenylate synthase, partial [Saprospiraceae bacterium]
NKLMGVLSSDGLVLLPTDTVWGIGCDATSAKAVEKIYLLKNRPKDKPLIVLVDGMEMLKDYVAHVHPKIETLLNFHERPLTVIYGEARNIAPNACANDGSIGIRIVRDDFCRKVISDFGKPIISTSANVSGQDFPRNFGEISSDILMGVDFVSKIKQSDKKRSEPSVIVKLAENGELEFLRE